MKTVNKKVPYHKKPEDMSIDEWQILLRQQYGITQDFSVSNIGNHPVYTDFTVYNAETESTYKVAIRSMNRNEGNFCSCPDFTINTLGTCKHIEYVLYSLQTNEQTQKFIDDTVKENHSSLSIRYEIERRIFLTIGDSVKNEMKECASEYFDEDGYLISSKLSGIHNFIEQAKIIDKDFIVYPDVQEYISVYDSEAKRKEKIKKLFSSGIDSPAFNNLINAELYPYQKEGVLFCLNAGRALLADDMGLGKTVQTIAAAELMIKEFNVKKVLIVCPTSLKYQWFSEIEKFTGKEANVIEGPIHKRKNLYGSNEHYCIISYGVIGNDLEYINSSKFDLIVLDEAQRIKNWSTKTAKNVKQLKSEYAIVLTGTPIENKIEELHSIVEFIDRYKLGVLFKFLYKHQLYDDSGKIIGYRGLKDIKSSLSDVLLRRTKNEIIKQLPGRTDKTYFVKMTSEQLKYHKSYYDIVSQIVSKWKRKGILTHEERQTLLINLNCMRMACDSTYILDQETRYDTKIDELMKILDDVFSDRDTKVVIFSQWVRMNDLVAAELDKQGINYEYLHGGIQAHKRQKLIDTFHNDNSCRVFLSSDAGGVGLNLQCANVLINLDMPWNPAVLEQRIGRIYRLGQKEKVRIINMVSQGTIEHRILYLLNFKKSVFKGVLEDGDDTVLMNEDGVKSFMDSIEALTGKDDDIYFTPHATQLEEDHDYEGESKATVSIPVEEKNDNKNDFGLNIRRRMVKVYQSLKGLFK